MKRLRYGIICLIFIFQLVPSLFGAVTSSQIWTNQSHRTISWWNTATSSEDKFREDYRTQSTYSGSATGFKEFTDWITPANSWYIGDPGAIFAETSTYTLTGSTHDRDYDLHTGHAANVTTNGAATVYFDMDYKSVDSAGVPYGSTQTYSTSTSVGGAGTYSSLFYDKTPSQATITGGFTVY